MLPPYEEQVAEEMQEREISTAAAAAQDNTEAASPRFAPVIRQADAPDFAQLSPMPK